MHGGRYRKMLPKYRIGIDQNPVIRTEIQSPLSLRPILGTQETRTFSERRRIDPCCRRTDPRRVELNPHLKIGGIETPRLNLMQCLEIIVCKLPLGQLLLEKALQIGRRQLHSILNSHNFQLFPQNPFYPLFA